jgi:Uma2 family endonuclease
MSSPEPNLLTPGEYLALERKSQTRSEYIPWRMIALPQSGRRHSLINGNLFRELSSQLRGRAGEAHVAGLRVKVSATEMYAYPDIVALCAKPLFEDEHCDTLLNPAVIIEVLSDSTELYDRGEKFAHYREIDSLREYVLVSQDGTHIEHFRRPADSWILSDVDGPDAVLHLVSIDYHVALSRIYEKVDFL